MVPLTFVGTQLMLFLVMLVVELIIGQDTKILLAVSTLEL